MEPFRSSSTPCFGSSDLGPSGKRFPLANHQRFASADVGEVRDYMGALFSPHYLERSRDIPSVAFRHYGIDLGNVSFDVVDYGLDHGSITVTAPRIEGGYMVQFSLAGNCAVSQGRGDVELAPGKLFVVEPDRPLAERLSSGYVHLMMRVKRAAMQRVLARDLGFMPDKPVIFNSAAQPLTGMPSSLLRMVSTVCEDLDSAEAGLGLTRVVPHLEETLVSLLLSTVPHNFSDLLDRASCTPTPYYVRRVLSYIAAHARDPITLSDLVAVSGVSARSLHSGFRHYKDTTPMGYLKTYRLDLARRELAGAEGRDLSVTDVALACGFNHLSKFARDYRARFGESPSQTRSGRGG
jgi:AraC-like DNA-binding protein